MVSRSTPVDMLSSKSPNATARNCLQPVDRSAEVRAIAGPAEGRLSRPTPVAHIPLAVLHAARQTQTSETDDQVDFQRNCSVRFVGL